MFLVSYGFICLKEPDSAFLGFAKLFFNFSKSSFFIKTSPLTSISFGKSISLIVFGMSLIVFKFY